MGDVWLNNLNISQQISNSSKFITVTMICFNNENVVRLKFLINYLECHFCNMWLRLACKLSSLRNPPSVPYKLFLDLLSQVFWNTKADSPMPVLNLGFNVGLFVVYKLHMFDVGLWYFP